MWACSTASCTAVLHFCSARPPQPPQHEVIWRVIYYKNNFAAAGIRPPGHGQRFRGKVRPAGRKSPPGGSLAGQSDLVLVIGIII